VLSQLLRDKTIQAARIDHLTPEDRERRLHPPAEGDEKKKKVITERVNIRSADEKNDVRDDTTVFF
jgi:hypothetical protein